jgi:hypothetical protein
MVLACSKRTAELQRDICAAPKLWQRCVNAISALLLR